MIQFSKPSLWSRHFRLGVSLGLTIVTMIVASSLRLIAQQNTPAGFRAYSLSNVEASEVASKLRSILPSATKILVDHKMNRVLVQGSADTNRIVSDMIRTMDQPIAGPQNGRENASGVLRAYPIDADQLQNVATQLRRQYAGRDDVRIATDERTNHLMVVAPLEVQEQVAAKYGSQGNSSHPNSNLRNPSPNLAGPPTRRSYQLQNISWREFEDELDQIWGKQLSISTNRTGELATLSSPTLAGGRGGTIHVDRRRNYITFEGENAITKTWTNLIESLDKKKSKDGEQKAVRLGRADPEKVKRAISLLEALSNAGNEKTAKAILRRANPDDARGWGGRLVATIFQGEGKQAEGNQEKQPDDNAPDRGAPADQNARQGAGGGLIGPVRIEFLEELDILIIRGHPLDVARVTEIIKQIEKYSEDTQPDVQIYQLNYINGQAVTDLVSQLYDKVYAPRQGPVTITPLVTPNALLLVGRPEATKSVISLIRRLDLPVRPKTQFEVFKLRHMSAVDAEQRIANFFQSQVTGQAPGQVQAQPQPTTPGQTPPGLAPRVRVVGDYRSNSLIVQASPRDMDQVAQLLEEIDVNDSGSVNEVKVFKLKNALAPELAPILQDALNGQLQGAGRGQTGTGAGAAGLGGQQVAGQAGIGQTQVAQIRSAMLSLMTVDSETGKLLKSGIMFDVRVTADTNSNSLVVTGPAENMELIAALIEQLDQLPSAEALIKVFTVINGDATTLLTMLQQLFGQQATGQGVGQQGSFGQLPLQSAAAAGDSSLVPIRFAIDVRTNSIIASGTEGDLLVVETLLTRLEIDQQQSRETRVFRLHNAFAQDVAVAITDLFDGRRSINQIDPNVISTVSLIAQEVVVVAEAITNSLIVSATSNYFDEVERIIQQLDKRAPMVMIQVLIAEVQLDNAEEFGIELGLQDSLLFNRGIGVIGFPFNQAGLGNNSDATSLASRENLAGQALSNLNVGRTNLNLGYGGLVLSAGNESVNVLLRALHDRGRIQVLSRPQVMTVDNLAAFIHVGQVVRFITGTQTTNLGGGVNNTVQPENVGIVLGVTPRTSPDGLIVMEIDAIKSELGSDADGTPVFTDANGNVVNIPPVNTTTAQSTISARSGQTVVFAGLITKSNASIRRGIPIISDWPVVGPFFRFDREVSQRKELLIILTPYIVNGDEDIEWMNGREAQRMSWCLADVVDVQGETSLTAGQGFIDGPQPEVIYPDVDPTGTESRANGNGIIRSARPADASHDDQSSRRNPPGGGGNSASATAPRNTRPVRSEHSPAKGDSPATTRVARRWFAPWFRRNDQIVPPSAGPVPPENELLEHRQNEIPRLSRLPSVESSFR